GNLVVGGAKAEGGDGSSITVNIPTVGRIPGGGIVEKAVPSAFTELPFVTLNLKTPSFNTARNIEQVINKRFGAGTAAAKNAGSIKVSAPKDASMRVSFLAMLENLSVTEGQQRSKIVINSRTGTVVMNEKVYVRRAAVAHGNLTVTISEQDSVSQPNSLSAGSTERVRRSRVKMDEGANHMVVMPEGTSLDKIVAAINAFGATPSDLMSILQALDEAGALDADLIVI
ncbi:MAG: flagellar basal body P-ring protein FlgI, partial [Plesiomonas sp.]